MSCPYSAVALIARLNGALALAQQAKPLRFGGVLRIDADGVLHQTFFAEGGSFEFAGLDATLTIGTGADGEPRPSLVQRWSSLADKDAFLNDALVYFGKGSDWFDIYKALECLELKFGGESKLMALGWASKTQIELLKRTANFAARHANSKFEPPPNLMTLKEARTLVGQLLNRAFEL